MEQTTPARALGTSENPSKRHSHILRGNIINTNAVEIFY